VEGQSKPQESAALVPQILENRISVWEMMKPLVKERWIQIPVKATGGDPFYIYVTTKNYTTCDFQKQTNSGRGTKTECSKFSWNFCKNGFP